MVHLASLAQRLRLGLHPSRLPPLRRVDHRYGDQRRGTYHHPVGPGPGAGRRLEGPGIFRRARLLAPRPCHVGPDPPHHDRPGLGTGTVTMSRPSMTPRFIVPVPTSGAPVPSPSTPPAAPIGPPLSAPTTGSSWALCYTNP